jgi:hypothetical protein
VSTAGDEMWCRDERCKTLEAHAPGQLCSISKYAAPRKAGRRTDRRRIAQDGTVRPLARQRKRAGTPRLPRGE